MACEGWERGKDSAIRTGNSTASAIRKHGLALIQEVVVQQTGRPAPAWSAVIMVRGLIKLEKFPGSGLSSPQLERFAIQQLRSSLCRKLTRLDERRQCASTNSEYQNAALIGWFDEAVNQTRGEDMRTLRFSVDASFCAVEENGELSMASQEDIETLPQGPDLTQAEIESLDERT